MNLQRFHTPKLLQVLQVLQWALLLTTCLLTTLVLWLTYQWQAALHSELTYFVSPQGTYACFRRSTPHNIEREAFEIEHFTQDFLEHALAHNAFTWEQRLEQACQVMDQKSGLVLQAKCQEEDLLALYVLDHGLSTLALGRIAVDQQDYPYTVKAYYTLQRHRIGLAPQEVPGGVAFQVHTTARSRGNPYGLIITGFHFIPYVPNPTPGR